MTRPTAESDDLPYLETPSSRGTTPYDVSKSCADLICQTYNLHWELPVCVSRCGNIWLEAVRLTPGVRATVVASSDKAYGESDDLRTWKPIVSREPRPTTFPSPARTDLPDLQPALGVARLRLALREHLARGRTTRPAFARRSSHRVTRPTASRTISRTWKPIVSREPRPTTFPSPART